MTKEKYKLTFAQLESRLHAVYTQAYLKPIESGKSIDESTKTASAAYEDYKRKHIELVGGPHIDVNESGAKFRIDWSIIPDNFKFVGQDADGYVVAFEHEPILYNDREWINGGKREPVGGYKRPKNGPKLWHRYD